MTTRKSTRRSELIRTTHRIPCPPRMSRDRRAPGLDAVARGRAPRATMIVLEEVGDPETSAACSTRGRARRGRRPPVARLRRSALPQVDQDVDGGDADASVRGSGPHRNAGRSSVVTASTSSRWRRRARTLELSRARRDSRPLARPRRSRSERGRARTRRSSRAHPDGARRQVARRGNGRRDRAARDTALKGCATSFAPAALKGCAIVAALKGCATLLLPYRQSGPRAWRGASE